MRRQLFLLVLVVICASGFCTQPANAQTSGVIAGTWFGSIVILQPDGKVSHDTAVLVIGQTTPSANGSMGRTIDQLTPWADGSFKNNQLQFHLDAAGGLNVNLTLLGNRLEGAATSQRMKAQIDLKPAPGLLPHQQLQQEIMTADRQLYAAFENCDVAGYTSFFSKDMEFYHDRTGKTGYQENLKALQNRCAEGIRLRKELEEDSLVVNATPGFSAIQAGIHRFYSRGQDPPWRSTSKASRRRSQSLRRLVARVREANPGLHCRPHQAKLYVL